MSSPVIYVEWSGAKLHIIKEGGGIFCGRKIPWERAHWHDLPDLPVCDHCDRWAAYDLGAKYKPALRLRKRLALRNKLARGCKATQVITQRGQKRRRALRRLSEPHSLYRLASTLARQR